MLPGRTQRLFLGSASRLLRLVEQKKEAIKLLDLKRVLPAKAPENCLWKPLLYGCPTGIKISLPLQKQAMGYAVCR